MGKNKVITVFKQKSSPDYVRFSGDGQVLLSVNYEQEMIQTWSVYDRKIISKIKLEDFVTSIFALNNNGDNLVLSDNNPMIVFWDILGKKKIKEIFYEATALNFSSSNDYFIIWDANGIIRLFDGNSYSEILSFKAHEDEIKSICFTHDSSKIITACNDSSIKIFEIISHK